MSGGAECEYLRACPVIRIPSYRKQSTLETFSTSIGDLGITSFFVAQTIAMKKEITFFAFQGLSTLHPHTGALASSSSQLYKGPVGIDRSL